MDHLLPCLPGCVSILSERGMTVQEEKIAMTEDITEQDILQGLMGKDEKAAFALAQKIGAESVASDRYLNMIPSFCTMLEAKNAFQRTRAFMLICNQARWDERGTINQIFDRMIQVRKIHIER